MLHWWLEDDLYKPDEHGSNILVSLSNVPHFNRWMGDVLRPYLGTRVLEIGAGIGNLTRRFTPRDGYTATDINPHYIDYLRRTLGGRPYLDVKKCDLADARDFEELRGRYDTVVCLNVLEHVPDEAGALANLRAALQPGGRAIVLVPQNPNLHGTLDEVLGHVRRYTRKSLRDALETAGFEVEHLFDFNRATTPAWWWNGKVLRRRHFGRLQLKIVNHTVWLMRPLDSILPWHGTSLVAVAKRR
jgi:SAM-dependent methyltransferase